MIVPAWLRLTLLSICAAPGLAGQTDHPPKPKPGQAVASWESEQRTSVIAIGTRIIHARNDTTVPIAFTEVHLRDCTNVRTSCDTHSAPTRVIAPGGTEDLMSVQPEALGHRPKFSFDVDWRPVPECSNAPLPPPDDTAAVRRAQPIPSQMILPPGRRYNSTIRADIDLFVGANGVVDSTQIGGVTDRDLLSMLKKTFAGYGFRPGTYNGCPVPGTYRYTITFGPGSG